MKKLVLGIVCLSLLVGLMVWLWTLQPQRKQATPANTKIEGTHAATLQDPSAIDPPDGTILKTAAIKIKGKTGAYNFLAVYTNDSATIIKVNPNTNFEVPFTATKGLNQIVLAGITQDLKTAEQKTLTYFLDPNQSSKKVFAGSVKSIFDTLITLGTAGGDASVRTGKSTQFDIPKEQDEATTSSQIQSVRIGDFVIAFGNPPEKGENSDSIIADKVQILRTSKPQNQQNVAFVKILSVTKQNIVNTKNLAADKNETYHITKNTDIAVDGKDARPADILKDKNAIVIFGKSDNDNLINLIYVLP